MKYVNDLTKVRPEEIMRLDDDDSIQAIVEIEEPINNLQEVVVIWKTGHTASYSKDGRTYAGLKQLFVYRTVKKEGWINVYKHNLTSGRYGATIFKTEEEAKHMESMDSDYVATIKICWEE